MTTKLAVVYTKDLYDSSEDNLRIIDNSPDSLNHPQGPLTIATMNVRAFAPHLDELIETATLFAAAPAMLNALRDCLDIMAYYHKAATPENAGHLDVCDYPECCGHCKTVLKAKAAIRAATEITCIDSD